jgi:tetratricopeptide (TPR) repeat protein
MPVKLICCVSLPPATISSVPIADFANANEELAKMETEVYSPCCGKSICGGCADSFGTSGNLGKCPFCNSVVLGKTDGENIQDVMKRVEANDAGSMCGLACNYEHGSRGLRQDSARAMELYTRAAELGSSKAHYNLGIIYNDGGDLKKAKFHLEAAAMSGHEVARNNLGIKEAQSGNMERAMKHWIISASAGSYHAMHNLLIDFKRGVVSRDTIDSTLTAYNNSCAEMRSEARDAAIHADIGSSINEQSMG